MSNYSRDENHPDLDNLDEDELWMFRLLPEEADPEGISEDELAKAWVELSDMRASHYMINAVEMGYLDISWSVEAQELQFRVTETGQEMLHFERLRHADDLDDLEDQ